MISQVSHLSDKQFKRIKSDTEGLSQLVSVLATGVQQSKVGFKKKHLKNYSMIATGEVGPA